MLRKINIAFSCILLVTFGLAQPAKYTTTNAHSHNDYEQKKPFSLAYNESFGSIEADIHLVNGILLVGHDAEDLDSKRTLETLYLIPINKVYRSKQNLQLMIDVKTEAISTLQALVDLLKRYPKIISSDHIRIVVSGNRPQPALYVSYPNFIWFDGRLEQQYTADELKKIAMLSEDFTKFTNNNRDIPISENAKKRIQQSIQDAHLLNKPVRFWGNPDFPEGWEALIQLGVDYINTDHIQQLAAYLRNRK